MVRNTSVSNLIVQQKSQKTVDQANTKIQRFTRFMDRIMTKNDPPSDSKVDKAEKFVADRTKGNKDPNTSNFMTDMLLSGSVFMLPFLLTRGAKTNEVDPETELKERFGGDDQLMKEQLKKEDDQRKEGLENVKSAVKKDEKVALEKRSDVEKIKEPEKDQEDPAQPDPQKDQEPIQQKGEEQAQEEKKEEKEKQKVEKTNEQRFKELVDRFEKLSKGQVFSGLAKDVVKGALNTGKKAVGKLFNFFTGVQPAAAAEMSDKVQTLSNVKEVFLYDKTTIQRKKIVQKEGEVKPQEDVMGKAVEKELVYDQNLPIEERKKIIYEMAVKAGAKFPEAVVAQYQLETTAGEDNVGTNNFFNLKAVEGMDYTEKVVDEYEVDGEKYQEKAKFINFDSAQDSIDYLVKLWYKDYKGYTGVETGSENAGEVAEKLQAETFATDPNYADKLKRVLKENEGLINKIKQGKASPDEISKLEMKTGFTSDELASVEDYNEEMFGEGGGDITLIVFNNDAGSSVNGGQSTPPTARRIPPSNEFVPVFDKLAVVELHQIHALGAS